MRLRPLHRCQRDRLTWPASDRDRGRDVQAVQVTLAGCGEVFELLGRSVEPETVLALGNLAEDGNFLTALPDFI